MPPPPVDLVCAGSMALGGAPALQLVRGAGDPPLLGRAGRSVTLTRGARAYAARRCDAASFNRTDYAALRLLGRTLSVTVDVSAAGCGCVAAFYLVPMRRSFEPGTCNGDRYCDANAVCGVRCSEIDVLEANRHALLSTVHTADDCYGQGNGLGGKNKAFNSSQYGPGGSVVDTRFPFRAHAYFEAGKAVGEADGQREGLARLRVALQGIGGGVLRFDAAPPRCLQRHSRAVRDGLTLVLSYWSSADVGWFDTPPCARDLPESCGASVAFSAIDVRDGPPAGFGWRRAPLLRRPRASRAGGELATEAAAGPSSAGRGGLAQPSVDAARRRDQRGWVSARGAQPPATHRRAAPRQRACVDSAAWENFSGKRCADYEAMWCAGGAFRPGAEWTGGPKFNRPERHCCACGRYE